MTGFCGLIAPVESEPDRGITEAMEAAVAPVGPDRQGGWQAGRAMLAHALLATTSEEEKDCQPLSLDGETWVVADARIDARTVLIDSLRAAGRAVAGDAPDSLLVLHAWHAWGDEAPAHLIGDYAFAIWEKGSGTLFAARDQFGSVPFYYAEADGAFLFGNHVPALLAHPRLDRMLNRQAISDYLMVGYSLEPDAGFYRAIRRLPPAHSLSYAQGAVRVRRFWAVPEIDPDGSSGRPDDDLVTEFGETLAAAVADRVRAPSIATSLSGGMDSTLITSLALRTQARVDAYSFGGDWLLPDTERHWAWRCAHHMGVPFHSVSVERAFLDPPGGRWRLPPEPRMELLTSSFHLVGERMQAVGTRVLLMGMGGDAIVSGGATEWADLARSRRFGRLAREAWGYWRAFGTRPPVRSALTRQRALPAMPTGLDPDFVREQRLDERWREAMQASTADPRVRMATHPFWAEMFVASHPGSTGMPIRARQPFFDVRLLELAMRLPVTPWQFGKAMLRRVGAGLLPDDILKRAKTPFGVNPAWETARRGLEPWLRDLEFANELEGFVDRDRLRAIVANIEHLPPGAYTNDVLLPAGLAFWLRANRG